MRLPSIVIHECYGRWSAAGTQTQRGKPMNKHTAYIGLDTHKKSIAVAIADGERNGEVRYYGSLANEPAAIAKLIKKLAGLYESLHFCYEAGPFGYGLYRQI